MLSQMIANCSDNDIASQSRLNEEVAFGLRQLYSRNDAKENFNRTPAGHDLNEFQALYYIVQFELQKSMDPGLGMTEVERSSVQPRKPAVSEEMTLFLFLHILRGGNNGCVGLDNLSTQVGLGLSNLANYFRHVFMALFTVLKDEVDAVIQWPTSAERESFHGLVCGFPKYVAFLDGTKKKILRSVDDYIQEEIYYGQHRFNC